MTRTLATTAAVFALAIAGSLGGCAGLGTQAQIATIPHCTEIYFPIYFSGRSAELTRAARAVISNAGAHAKGCTVAGVEVEGLADYLGPPQPNLDLSRKRAERVAAALVQVGLPAPSFQIGAAGAAGALADDGTVRPVRRKADVFIRFMR